MDFTGLGSFPVCLSDDNVKFVIIKKKSKKLEVYSLTSSGTHASEHTFFRSPVEKDGGASEVSCLFGYQKDLETKLLPHKGHSLRA